MAEPTASQPSSSRPQAEDVDRAVEALVAAAENSGRDAADAAPPGAGGTAVMSEPPPPSDDHPLPGGEEAIAAVETVDQLLADVAAELLAEDPAPVPHADASASSESGDDRSGDSVPEALVGESRAAQAMAEVSDDLTAAQTGDEPGLEQSGSEPASPEAPPARPASEASIDQLDEVLAETAEDVLEAETARAAEVPSEVAPSAPATPPPAAQAVPPGPAASAAAPPAATPPAAPAASAGKPASAAKPAAAPAESAPTGPGLAMRLLRPLADLSARMSPTMRQTISWLSVYTFLLALGVWGFLLLRGGEQHLEPTSDPAVFLKPGEHAPPPKPKAAEHGDAGHGDARGDSHGAGHGKASSHASGKAAAGGSKASHGSTKSGSHGSSTTGSHGASGHGAAKKTEKKPSKPDSHGAADKKKSSGKSKDSHGGGHH